MGRSRVKWRARMTVSLLEAMVQVTYVYTLCSYKRACECAASVRKVKRTQGARGAAAGGRPGDRTPTVARTAALAVAGRRGARRRTATAGRLGRPVDSTGRPADAVPGATRTILTSKLNRPVECNRTPERMPTCLRWYGMA